MSTPTDQAVAQLTTSTSTRPTLRSTRDSRLIWVGLARVRARNSASSMAGSSHRVPNTRSVGKNSCSATATSTVRPTGQRRSPGVWRSHAGRWGPPWAASSRPGTPRSGPGTPRSGPGTPRSGPGTARSGCSADTGGPQQQEDHRGGDERGEDDAGAPTDEHAQTHATVPPNQHPRPRHHAADHQYRLSEHPDEKPVGTRLQLRHGEAEADGNEMTEHRQEDAQPDASAPDRALFPGSRYVRRRRRGPVVAELGRGSHAGQRTWPVAIGGYLLGHD